MNPPQLTALLATLPAALLALLLWLVAGPVAQGASPAPPLPTPAVPPIVEPGQPHPLLRSASQPSPRPASTVPLAPSVATSATLPLKLTIEAEGFYRVTYGALQTAGFDPATVSPRQLQLSHRGQPVAMLVVGEEDGHFDPGDELRFFAPGIPITSPVAIYTGQDVYWLSADSSPGLRVATRDATTAASAPLLQAFDAHLYAEEESAYWQAMPRDVEPDRWFWGGRLSPDTAGLDERRDYPVTLHLPAPDGGEAELRVGFKGFTAGDHRTRLSINGIPVDDQEWSGQLRFVQRVMLDATLLQAGPNTITVEALASGASVDQVLVDYIALDYRAALVARDGQLIFTTPAGSHEVAVTGYEHDEILLFEISQADAPVVVSGQSRLAPDGSAAVHFTSAAAGRYAALLPDALQVPQLIAPGSSSGWRTSRHGADLVIIAHREFVAPVEPLAQHRRSQGLRVVVVPVDELYDEFNHGIFDPAALRNFLAYAVANWQPPAPQSVLLVGDAYQDYRNRLYPPESGLRNWVPAQLVYTELLGETSSDSWFGNVDLADAAPELAVGRLPVRDSATLTAIIDKLIAYDRSDEASSDILLVADDDDSGFALATRRIAAQLDGARALFIDAAAYPPGDPSVELLAALAEGLAFVHYSGHGDVARWGSWAKGTLLQVDDLMQARQRAPPFLVTMANCLSNFFVGSSLSLGEAFLTQPDGAIAVWGPTGLGTAPRHAELIGDFYEALTHEPGIAVGEAARQAQAALAVQDSAAAELAATYVLLGDPTTQLHLPSLTRRVLLPIVRRE